MKTIFRSAILAVTLSSIAAFAQAYPGWVITSQGIITEGRECDPWQTSCQGIFGLGGQDLAGQAYKISVTASIDPAHWTHVVDGNTEHYLGFDGPRFYTTITVNGYSVTYNSWHTAIGQQMVKGSFSPPYGWSEWSSYNVGRTAIDEYLMAAAGSENGGNYGHFELIGNNYHTWFRGQGLGSGGLRGTQIPEPSSLALFGLSIAAFGGVRYRIAQKRKK